MKIVIGMLLAAIAAVPAAWQAASRPPAPTFSETIAPAKRHPSR